MFCIDDKKLKITEQKVLIGNYIKEGENGYYLGISLKFLNCDTEECGYLNLDVGFERENTLTCFINTKYRGLPFSIKKEPNIYIEVYDTEKFLDTEIESEIIVDVGNIENNQLKVMFEVDDELIKIKYDGYLDIVSK